MKISIVMATFNRIHLLRRSLMGYERSTHKDFELIIVDDWSTDETDAWVRIWAEKLNIIYLRPPFKPRGTWRSEASIINIGLRAAKGELILATHPEIIPGTMSLEYMWTRRAPRTWHTCKPYFLTPNQQSHLDDVIWTKSNTAVRELPGFYTEELHVPHGGGLYDHASLERSAQWESWQFGGGMRDMWQRIGGMYPFKTWGSVDMWLAAARRYHNIPTVTEMVSETYVIHQNHDRGTDVTPRDHDLFKTLEGIPLTAEEFK